MVKVIRFGRDRSIHQGKAEPLPLEGVFRVNMYRAFKVSKDPSSELWTYPLWGFGGKIKFLPWLKAEPLVTQVIGEGVTLTPSIGHKKHYRDGSLVSYEECERISSGAEYNAAQLIESGTVKQKGETLLKWLGAGFILELIVFAAVVLPIVIPKLIESFKETQ